VTKEEELKLTVSGIQFEHEHSDQEAQTPVNAGNEQERQAW